MASKETLWVSGVSGGNNKGGTSFNRAPNKNQIEGVLVIMKKLTATPKERGEALQYLSVNREHIPDLAKYLWYSPSTITVLLGEIVSAYPYLATNNLDITLSHRVCNALALFQCVAGHDETRMPFVKANIPMYLFPFLHHINTSKEAEYLKLTSLGIIGSLVQTDQPEIIEYLLNSDFVPMCLRILKFSQEISRTVAAFIIQKIICDEGGRKFICSSKEKIETVIKVLNKVLVDMSKTSPARLFKHVIASYQRLLEVSEVKIVLSGLQMPDIATLDVDQIADEQFKQFLVQLKHDFGCK